MKPNHRLMFYDEFSVSEQNSCYYGWAKRNTRPQVKSNEASRKRLNGMLAIDVESGEEYLWLSSHAQSDDVARYMAHLTLQMDELGVERLEIVLDQNTTHKQRMQQLYQQELNQLSLQQQRQIKTALVFTYLPAYSPKLNIVEYAIHLLRQRCLHHRPYNMKMDQIEQLLTKELWEKQLLSAKQIINIIHYIEKLIHCSNLTGYVPENTLQVIRLKFYFISANWSLFIDFFLSYFRHRFLNGPCCW